MAGPERVERKAVAGKERDRAVRLGNRAEVLLGQAGEKVHGAGHADAVRDLLVAFLHEDSAPCADDRDRSAVHVVTVAPRRRRKSAQTALVTQVSPCCSRSSPADAIRSAGRRCCPGRRDRGRGAVAQYARFPQLRAHFPTERCPAGGVVVAGAAPPGEDGRARARPRSRSAGTCGPRAGRSRVDGEVPARKTGAVLPRKDAAPPVRSNRGHDRGGCERAARPGVSRTPASGREDLALEMAQARRPGVRGVP